MTGSVPHRGGYRGGGGTRNRAAGGTAGAGAADEAPGSRRLGRGLISQRSLQKSHTHVA